MDGFVRGVAARRSDGSVRIESAALIGGTASVVIFCCSFKSGSATLIPKHGSVRDDTCAARFFGAGTVHNFPVRAFGPLRDRRGVPTMVRGEKLLRKSGFTETR
jgi:hypothetical protein